MRATIDWSVSLLPDIQRDMLTDLGVFATRFTLDAVEALGVGRSWDGHGLDGLTALVDGSLVKQTDDRRPVGLLAARDRARVRPRPPQGARRRRPHARRARRLLPGARRAPGAGAPRRGSGASPSRELGLELPNLRAAIRHLVYTDRLDDAGDFAWSLLIYWWIAGLFGGVRVWMLELLGKERPITAAHPGGRVVPRALGRDVAAAVEGGDRGTRRVRAAVHRHAATRMPRRWPSRPARRRGCSTPRRTSRRPRRSCGARR